MPQGCATCAGGLERRARRRGSSGALSRRNRGWTVQRSVSASILAGSFVRPLLCRWLCETDRPASPPPEPRHEASLEASCSRGPAAPPGAAPQTSGRAGTATKRGDVSLCVRRPLRFRSSRSLRTSGLTAPTGRPAQPGHRELARHGRGVLTVRLPLRRRRRAHAAALRLKAQRS